MQEDTNRPLGVSFFFKDSPQFAKISELSMNVHDRYHNQTQNQRFYNQMYNCSNDMHQIIHLSRYDSTINYISSFLDRRFNTIKLQSVPLLLWNLLVFVVVSILFVQNMFIIMIITYAYDYEVNPIYSDTLKTIIVILLVVDMLVVRPRVRVEIRGRRIRSHQETLRFYITHFLLADLLGIVIICVDLLTSRNLIFLKSIFYLKIVSIREINRQISYKLVSSRALIALYRFVKYSFFLVYWSFFISCSYVLLDLYMIDRHGYDLYDGFCWLIASPSIRLVDLYQDFEWYVWFQYSLFLFMQTARGCGYGVAAPRNPPEMLLVSQATMLIIIGIGYYTNGIISLIAKYNERDDEINTNAYLINNIKNQTEMPESTCKKHRNYIMFNNYTQQLPLINFMEENMPACHLRQFKYLQRQYFFMGSRFISRTLQGNKNIQFLKDVAEIINIAGLHKNQYLYRKGEVSQPKLYLSESRHIITFNSQINYFQKNADWDFVGLRQFFLDVRSLFDVKSRGNIVVEYIKKEDFIRVLKKYRNIYEIYCEEMDRTLIEREGAYSINLRCWFCEGYHLWEDCSFLWGWRQSFSPSFSQKQEQNTNKNERQIFQRKNIIGQRVRKIQIVSLQTDMLLRSENYFSGVVLQQN